MRARSSVLVGGLAALLGLSGCGGPAATTDAGTADAGDDAAIEIDAAAVCTVLVAPEDPLPEPARHTPRWAFEPWVSKDISDRDDTFAFVQGFHDHDIPVGVVVLDSPWDTNYTTFQPNPTRYPDFTDMVARLHADHVRVVLWVTQLTNQRSFDLEIGGDRYIGPSRTFVEGQACGFFAQNGQTYSWWKGVGSGVDFFDARARAWWHQQQEYLLMEAGIDGWKLDFGDSYMEADATLMTDVGPVPHQQYSEAYYRDYLAYGVSRRGSEFVTMVRPWDVSYDRRARFHARPEHAPVGWVGDNQRDWSGIADALDEMMRSAAAGYVVLGSDIGGYLDRDEHDVLRAIPFDLEVFQRWVALGAMVPFMQLHGRGNLAPWTVPGTPAEQSETVALYRYWAWLHHAMAPFWYSLAEEAYGASTASDLRSILHPIGTVASWAGDYSYVIGDAFLVAPIVETGGRRDVVLPAGARWYDWWAPGADALAGGTTLTSYDATDRGHLPMFVREGAIVPMNVENDVDALGSAASAGRLTILAWPGATMTSFRLREGTADSITTITLQRVPSGAVVIGLAPAHGGLVVRARLESAPAAVHADARALALAVDRATLDAMPEAYFYEAATRSLWVRVDAPAAVLTVD